MNDATRFELMTQHSGKGHGLSQRTSSSRVHAVYHVIFPNQLTKNSGVPSLLSTDGRGSLNKENRNL